MHACVQVSLCLVNPFMGMLFPTIFSLAIAHLPDDVEVHACKHVVLCSVRIAHLPDGVEVHA